MNVSTIPAPVAAEISGAGSFFGSCQIASGNFEAFLQSASEAPATVGYGTMAMPTPEATASDLDAEPEGMQLVKLFLEVTFKMFRDEDEEEIKEPNEVLAKLQELLGEEAGAEAFRIITDFLKKYEPLMSNGDAESNANSEFAGVLKIISHLMEFFDPKNNIAKMPIEMQKNELLAILEEIKIFEEVNTMLGNKQMPQQETDIAQPETKTAQPKAKTQQPGTKIPEPKAKIPQPETEVPQPKAEIKQPEIEIVQPETEILQPKAEIPQPETEAVQPKAEIPQPETEAVQPKAEIPQPEAEIAQSKAETAQPKAKIAQPTAEVEVETEEETSPIASIVTVDIRLYLLAKDVIGIKPTEDYQKFYEFMNDLLKQGLINLDDFDSRVIRFVKTAGEEKELNFFETTLKELWECVKNGDEPRKEEILSMLKQVAYAKETVKELKQILSTVNADIPDSAPKTSEATKNSEIPKTQKTFETSETSEEESGLELAKPEPVKSKQNKQGESKQAPVQPEVRAVWEANGLKIEIVNPKTGEKLQSTQTTMPHNMQEKIQEFEIIKQVVAQARFITTSTGEQRLTMHLRPEHLGQLDLRIILNHGEMQIHAKVESVTAQQALENQIGLLREGLEKQGINLERLEVSVEQKDRQDAYSLAERQEQQEQRRGGRRNHRRGRELHVAVSANNDANADTGRRLGYNTMEYLA